jgi:hypothetical protein
MLLQNSVFPAILTYTTITLTWTIFIFRQKIDRDKILVVIFSFLFIFSGFFVQTLVGKHDELQDFFEEWGKVLSSPPITVLATASGIFIGNTFLKLFSNETERREISILFINGVEAHVRSLCMIDFYFSNNNTNTANSRIYLTKFRENKNYEKALMGIGKFRDDETDMLSKYESHLWTTLVAIERNLNGSIIPISCSRLKITATVVYAMLCSCTLAHKHWPIQEKAEKQSFFRDFPLVTQWLLDKPIECNSIERKGFVEVFIDIKKRYQCLYGVSILPETDILQILYLPLCNSRINSKNELELMIFDVSIDKMKDKARKYLNSYYHMPEIEIEQMIEHSQSEIISPWD